MSAADERLLRDVRQLHEEIRAEVAERLTRARSERGDRLTSRPGGWGAGDRSYALDEAADAALAGFLARVGARRPLTLVAEGPGVQHASPPRAAPEAPAHDGGTHDTAVHAAEASDAAPEAGGPLRVIVDPIDGTRPLMHDMRSAWVLTGVAPDRGEHTRLSQIELAVQTELPTTSAAEYRVLMARRGGGATLARHDVRSGECLEQRALLVDDELPLDNGVFSFVRYLPVERPLVAALEQRFLERAVPALSLDPHLLYDDQYLCTAGQLFLAATGRYRLLADLRAWLGARHGLANFAVKPYDLATLLVFTEAGLPVFDAQGAPLDGPLDTDTPMSVVAYGNASMRAAFAPHLRAAMEG